MKLISLILMVSLLCGLLSGCAGKRKEIIIGAKDFTEQYILAEILALLIEENTDISVTLRTDLSSDVIFAAIRTGVVDVYVDYTGTIYGSYLARSETRDPFKVYEYARNAFAENYNLFVLPPLGFNNTYNLAVTNEVAQEFQLQTITDLASVSENFIIGGSAEFLTRNDGLPNLKIHYDMIFKSELAVDGIDRYTSLMNDDIQVAETFATDGHILAYDITVLKDDKHFFLPYEGVIVMRTELSDELGIEPYLLFTGLTDLLTDDVMRDLNYRVDVNNEAPRDAAEYFLRKNNLIAG